MKVQFHSTMLENVAKTYVTNAMDIHLWIRVLNELQRHAAQLSEVRRKLWDKEKR